MKLVRLLILVVLLAVAAKIIGVGDWNDPRSQSRDDLSPASTQPIAIAPVSDRALMASGNTGKPDVVGFVPASGSMLLVDRRLESFGPAMLRFVPAVGEVEARLYSDESHDGLASDPTANSFDFDMKLPNITDAAQLNTAIWSYKSPSSDRQPSAFGIMLNKQQQLLQPMDVKVSFSGQAPNFQVDVQGVFWRYRTGSDYQSAPPEMVRVSGTLSASVPVK